MILLPLHLTSSLVGMDDKWKKLSAVELGASKITYIVPFTSNMQINPSLRPCFNFLPLYL